MKHKAFITTSIPYVNAAPHIGYALEAVQADALSRFYNLIGYDTYFLVGTDENAMKNVESAEKLHITTQELVDTNSGAFLKLKELLNLSYNQFIRTTSHKHIRGAQAFWNLCQKDIYKKQYKGLYCVGCETFYSEDDCKDGTCAIHERKLEAVSETNYFFRLSAYEKQLIRLIESDTLKIYPSYRKGEVLNFAKKGLEDISISRLKERTKGWGIPIPNDETQRMYVWFDALTNYITALDVAEKGKLFQKYWIENPNRIHIIGKDIIKFHALYWPAMLLSAHLPLPTTLFVHGFITSNGKKISKSLGNIVDPFDVVKRYGADAVRYYLLREIPSLDDGDFSESRMREIYQSDLANELGNLVSRLTTLGEKDALSVDATSPLPDSTNIDLLKHFDFNSYIYNVWELIKNLNRHIDEFAPWKKTQKERKQFLQKSLQEIHLIGNLLLPIMPNTANKIITASQGSIRKIAPLFPKK